jgi:TetR/AcrR family transcriptional regulator, cholesterol catabolism regulator
MERPRESILEAATQLFGDAGYPGTTMREIAKAVGVLAGSLYAHIDSKETLLLEIVESGIERFMSAVGPVAALAEPADIRIREAVKAHVRVVAENPQRTLVVFHQWRFLTGPARRRVVAMRREYEDLFADMVRAGVEEGMFNDQLDDRLALMTVLGAVNWTPEWFSPSGRATADEVGDHIADALLAGIRRRPRQRTRRPRR